ncbi:MAG TPA: hypothetical protein VGY54_19375 [Polyangiaceae bacterium]|nr:hypothetical protein [Polyangiaceae bacterium]
MARLSRPLGCLVILLGELSGSGSRAQDACPHDGRTWVSLNFSGSGWSPEQEEDVLRELRVELGRRSLDVCLPSDAGPDVPPPTAVVTLLANELDWVSIVPSQMRDEGAFRGRTIRVSAIPADARALAIAQAVDEVLRAEPPAIETAPPPEPATPIRVLEVAKEAPVAHPAEPSRLSFGVEVGPTLQIAPSGATGAAKTALGLGGSLRASMTRGRFGGSLGVVLAKSTELDFGSATIDQFRVPVDASARLRLRKGSLEGVVDVGLLVALLREQYAPAGVTYFKIDPGLRAGARASWGDRIAPWLGASLEVMPAPYDLRFAPEGTVGHTSTVWVGLSLGVEARWP